MNLAPLLLTTAAAAMISQQLNPNRGFLVAFEGGDRCGKSTQVTLTKEWLVQVTGRPVELWKFPDRTTEIGKIINAYLSKTVELPDEAIHLLFSANRWELK